MPPYNAALSIWERIDLLGRLFVLCEHPLSRIDKVPTSNRDAVPVSGAVNFLRGLPRARARGMSLKFFFIGVLFRGVLACIKPRQIQGVAPSTRSRYKQWISRKRRQEEAKGSGHARRLHQDIEPILGTDASILWIGDRQRATKFVLFFHGGGYVVAAIGGHFEWCWNAYVLGGPGEKEEVAVGLVHYTLCPKARYPGQLREVCAALGTLVNRGIRPADIMVGGDSAGASLTGQLIRHLVEPHPGIPPIMLKEPLAGAFMVSPVVDGRTDARSYRDNDAVDMISSAIVSNTSHEMFRPGPGEMSVNEMRTLAFPLEGDFSWMAQIDSVVKSLYLTGGKQEVFADHIYQFGELVRRQAPGLDMRLEMAEHEAHDYILVEGAVGEGDATHRMKNWSSEHL